MAELFLAKSIKSVQKMDIGVIRFCDLERLWIWIWVFPFGQSIWNGPRVGYNGFLSMIENLGPRTNLEC